MMFRLAVDQGIKGFQFAIRGGNRINHIDGFHHLDGCGYITGLSSDLLRVDTHQERRIPSYLNLKV